MAPSKKPPHKPRTPSRAPARSASAAAPADPRLAAIHRVIRLIPRGKVATYGQVARLAGLGRRARLVGYALRIAGAEARLPWQRVVGSPGVIAAHPGRNGAENLQRALLEREGIRFGPGGKIDLERYGWDPDISIMDPL